jgi:hypothetical protein
MSVPAAKNAHTGEIVVHSVPISALATHGQFS